MDNTADTNTVFRQSQKRKKSENSRQSSVVTTNESTTRTSTVRTTHCGCMSSFCIVCRVSDPETGHEQKRRKIGQPDWLESEEEEEEKEESLLSVFTEAIETHPSRVHEVMIKNSMDKVTEYGMQGSSFCEKFCCLAEGTEKMGEPVYKLLQRAGENVTCLKKGACRYKCVGACQRLAAYKAFAHHIGSKERAVLPTCVRIYINSLYGASVVGYKEKEF